jgi:FAD/FMN-containing dehydrogenase
MMKVETGLLKIKVTTAPNLKELLTAFGRQADAAEQLVGWIDAAASGRALGRGILHQATRVWADRVPDPAQTFTLQAQALRRSWLGLPFSLLKHTLLLARRPAGIGFLNGVKYRSTQLGEPWLDPRQSLADFSFLLDYIPDWKHTFRGLGQYQCLIPRDRALPAFTQILRHSQRRGLIPCLAVVKKHRPDRALLSCLLDGYSLALEYPLDSNDMARLRRLADELDAIVGEHGGTIYLAKNASLHPALHSALFPAERLERFFHLKQTCDPEGLLQSDLARRVFGAYC